MNILIVGLGSIAHKHIDALKRLNVECDIYALRSTQNRSDEEINIKNIYSLDEINNLELSFAIISNPTSMHKETILKLLKFNCPLFIEKPLYHKLDIEDILIAVNKQNILTYVACNLRFLDSLLFVKNELEQNKRRINEINVYCGSFLPSWRKTDYKQSYSTNPDLGGGVHLDLIHEIDYLYWMFGMPTKIQSVFRNVSSLDIRAYDYANYNLIYDEFCANVTLNYFRRDYKRTFELLYENETWLVDLACNTISSKGEIIYKSNQSIIDTYTSQMHYFLQLINTNGKTSINTFNDAYEVLKICLNNSKSEQTNY